jgi:chromosomal replication initiation ATPase DnaA
MAGAMKQRCVHRWPSETHVRSLARVAARRERVSLREVLGPLKHRSAARARFAVMLALEDYSTVGVGARLGRHHSCVVIGQRRAKQIAAIDPRFAATVEALRR